MGGGLAVPVGACSSPNRRLHGLCHPHCHIHRANDALPGLRACAALPVEKRGQAIADFQQAPPTQVFFLTHR